MIFNTLFHGENPTRADYILTYGVGIIGALLAVGISGGGWTLVQQIVIFVIALDVLGGIVSNATRSTNTWYHRQPRWVNVMFILAHIIQPVVLILAIDPRNWWYALGLYGYMLVSVLIVEALAGQDVQRPAAFGFIAIGIVIFTGILTTIPLLSWFAPAYLVKLVASHAVDHYGVKRIETD